MRRIGEFFSYCRRQQIPRGGMLKQLHLRNANLSDPSSFRGFLYLNCFTKNLHVNQHCQPDGFFVYSSVSSPILIDRFARRIDYESMVGIRDI